MGTRAARWVSTCFAGKLWAHAIPGDMAQVLLGDKGNAAQLASLRQQLALDKPLYVQYGRFVQTVLKGDLGRSYRTQQKVSTEIARAFPLTVELAVCSILVAVLIAVPVGVIAATRQNSIFDNVSMVGVLFGVSMPVFWIGLLLMLVGGIQLRLFPITGVLGDRVSVTTITGMYIVDSLLQGNFAALQSAISHLVLPTITLATVPMAIIARMTRSSMLEVLRQDYIRTAQAKGLGERVVHYRHALKNAVIPVITVVGLQFGGLLSGAVITETIFARPGLGRLAVASILSRDYSMIQGIVLVAAVIFVAINLTMDLLYGLVDPRIRYSGRR
ncbi:MAG: ABC transporter permease [Bacillota bacterium]